MTGLDWIIVAVIVLSVLAAIAQGFFFEIFSLAGVVVGYLIAIWQYHALAPLFLPYVKSPAFANLAGFLTIFFVVTLLASVAGKVTRWIMQEAGLRWIDRVLGGAFGLIRGLAAVTIGLLALATFAPESKLFNGSSLAPYFLLAGRTASYLAPYEVREKYRAGEDFLRGLRNPPQKSQAGD